MPCWHCQVVHEKTLGVEEGKSKYGLGRQRFVERVWQWKEKEGAGVPRGGGAWDRPLSVVA